MHQSSSMYGDSGQDRAELSVSSAATALASISGSRVDTARPAVYNNNHHPNNHQNHQTSHHTSHQNHQSHQDDTNDANTSANTNHQHFPSHHPTAPTSADRHQSTSHFSHPSDGHEAATSLPVWQDSVFDNSVMSEQSKPSQPEADSAAGYYRRSRACIACRRQKIKCHMDDANGPCRRCQRRKLSCVVNTQGMRPLLDENRLPFLDAVLQDLETMHNKVETLLSQLGLPAMGPAQISRFVTAHAPNPDHPAATRPQNDEVSHEGETQTKAMGPSCDNSPRVSPRDDNDLSTVPIRSMYHLTKLSVLRSPAASEDSPTPSQPGHIGRPLQPGSAASPPDFIARGKLSQEDADRLFRLYMDRLDHYMYGVVTSRYTDLATMRARSPILTAAVIAVAAMHDPGSNALYPVCTEELDRLVGQIITARRIDRDHLRALCVASYWLNNTSWVLSGLATRRATEFDVMGHFCQLGKDGADDEDAADFLRVWYLIFVCDQHLSTLHERPCSARQDAAVSGWQALVRRPSATAGDQRLASQVSLLMMVQEIRELFGSDRPRGSSGPVSAPSSVVITQVRGFVRQLDEWVAYWPSKFPEYQQGFGAFPRKGIHFHGNFAKLYLFAQAFRGLGSAPIPPHLSECAHNAATTARTIIEMIIDDDDVRAGLVGLPSYVQSMIGFACMILARLVSMHGDLIVERSLVTGLISRLRDVYHATPVGKWHLAYMMPDGLDRILAMLQHGKTSLVPAHLGPPVAGVDGHGVRAGLAHQDARFNDTSGGPMGGVAGSTAPLDPYLFPDSAMDFAYSQYLYDSFGFSGQDM